MVTVGPGQRRMPREPPQGEVGRGATRFARTWLTDDPSF
jgi:hypothetical protein